MLKETIGAVSNSRFLAVALAAYVLVYLVFFPSFYTSADEHQFLKASINYADLDIFEENPELAYGGYPTEFGYIARSFYTRPLFMVPFLPFGLAGVMLSGLVIHLLNFFILAAIFRKKNINLNFLILYLFFPTFVWSSRTLFAELLVGTFLLLGYLFYTSDKRSLLKSGFFFGLAFLTRFDAGVAFAAFLAPLAYDSLKGKGFSKPLHFFSGFAPSALFFGLSNFLIFNDPLRSSYGSTLDRATSIFPGQDVFSEIQRVLFDVLGLWDLAGFVLLLLAVYPLLFAGQFFSRENRPQFVLLSAGYLFVAAKFGNLVLDSGVSGVFIGSMRYLIPLAVLLLIPYSAWLQSVLEKGNLLNNKIFYAALVPLLLSALVVSSQHSEVLDNRHSTFEIIHANTPEGSLVVGSSDDVIYFQKAIFPQKAYLRIDEYKESPPSGYDVYFVSLSYSYRESRESSRQGLINEERKLIRSFISENRNDLELVRGFAEPNRIEIYRLKPLPTP